MVRKQNTVETMTTSLMQLQYLHHLVKGKLHITLTVSIYILLIGYNR